VLLPKQTNEAGPAARRDREAVRARAPHSLRIAAADFFMQARIAQVSTVLPLRQDRDTVSCPKDSIWPRSHSTWAAPGQPDALAVTDEAVESWSSGRSSTAGDPSGAPWSNSSRANGRRQRPAFPGRNRIISASNRTAR
jgi:hypothetical protein